MKQSVSGLMPLVVLWEWKREESGRRRGSVRQRQEQPQRQEEKAMAVRVWQTGWQGWGDPPEGSGTTLFLWTGNSSNFKFLCIATVCLLHYSGFCFSPPLSFFSLALLLCRTFVTPPPLNLPFCFSHPPTLSQHCTFSTCSSPASSRFYDSVKW